MITGQEQKLTGDYPTVESPPFTQDERLENIRLFASPNFMENSAAITLLRLAKASGINVSDLSPPAELPAYEEDKRIREIIRERAIKLKTSFN